MAITIGEYARAAWLADRVDRVIASVTGSHRLAIALLVLFSLLAFAPGLADISPIDRDEPRYAQATKQMMETGNYLDIRYQEHPRDLQPVGIYWLQAAAAWITGMRRMRRSGCIGFRPKSERPPRLSSPIGSRSRSPARLGRRRPPCSWGHRSCSDSRHASPRPTPFCWRPVWRRWGSSPAPIWAGRSRCSARCCSGSPWRRAP